jgi:hypothetical protein
MGIGGRGPPSPIEGGEIVTCEAEELAVLYAEFDQRFSELERLIWRIRELKENEVDPSPKLPERSKTNGQMILQISNPS